jgi:hypothetical protein
MTTNVMLNAFERYREHIRNARTCSELLIRNTFAARVQPAFASTWEVENHYLYRIICSCIVHYFPLERLFEGLTNSARAPEIVE